MALQVFTHAKEILTGQGILARDGRRVREEDLSIISDGALVFDPKPARGKIAWVGPTSALPKKYLKLKKKDLKQAKSLMPGLVDCHTHLIFAGDRADEFARRCGGATYAEIAASGGGIQKTVNATRAASEAELFKLAGERLAEAYFFGVRTLEIKSGYGLSLESELKILRVAAKLKKAHPEVTFHTTFLGAHGFPKDQTREAYLRELLEKMLPAVARGKLADSCDVFIDEGYFSLNEGREILKKARALGLKIKLHADELRGTGSAELGAELNALSCDHLLKVSDRGIQALAQSPTVAVLLPGTAFYLKEAHAPARRLIDSGAKVALATDFNPGTSMTLSLPSILTIAALYLQMTKAELFAAVTYNAASALGLQTRKGVLKEGYDSDFIELPFESFEEMYYRFAWSAALKPKN